MTNDLKPYDDIAVDDVFLPATVFDTERFEQVMRVADVMARATTIPDHLKGRSDNPHERFEETRGNCFMICNQSSHWGMDPFAVAQATAFVYGKICYEGKLIRAVIRKKLGFDLHYVFVGDAGNMDRTVYVSDKPFVDDEGKPLTQVQIDQLRDRPGNRITVGTLAKWHTKAKSGGVNDNWLKDEDKMFRERGSREWCRQWAPGLMLGVYSPDEFDEVENTSRSSRAKDITPPSASNPLLEDSSGAAMDRINTDEKASSNSGAQPGTSARTTTSAKSAHQADAASSGRTGRSPTNSSSAASSSRGSDEQSSGGAPSASQRATAGTLKEFSSALVRFSGTGNGRDADMQKLTSATEAFWKDNGGKPDHPADIALSKTILAVHLKRMAGEVTIEAAKAEVEKLVDGSFNGL